MATTERKLTAFEARTHLGEALDYIRYTRKPCLIEKHGKVVAALVDIETYRARALKEQYREWIKDVVEKIKVGYRPQKIILFGSAAEEPRDGSDIDLFIIKETDRRMIDRSDDVLEFIDPATPVELHVYTPEEVKNRLEMGDFFVEQIIKNGKILYEQRPQKNG
ncbi:MAG: type II toxin-antitoxin system Phd/YefM family antitoxin [Pseudomonadota bacterium]